MTTHRETMLAVMRGNDVDVIPYAPRLDLWWLANKLNGTLPQRFADMKPDDIAKAEGWALYHMIPDFTNMMRSPEDILHRAIGLYNFKQSVYTVRFPADVKIEVENTADGLQSIQYHTPLGTARTLGGHTEQMKRQGASLGWTCEHAVKTPADARVMGYIFSNLEVFRNYDGAREYENEIGDGGVVAAGGASLAASPMHHIQKELIDPTEFFLWQNDEPDVLAELSESIGVYFDKVLNVIADSPMEVVLWGANYDETLTYPPYFEREILPWLQKVAQRLHAGSKIMVTHTDGENQGLMGLIARCGADVAESITPHPMTKVSVRDYYRNWSSHMTLMGLVPECVTLANETSDAEFEAFMDELFKSIAPGRRVIIGIADSTPPHASFERLQRIGERVAKEGRLPIAI